LYQQYTPYNIIIPVSTETKTIYVILLKYRFTVFRVFASERVRVRGEGERVFDLLEDLIYIIYYYDII